jgi:hypothetical protein
MRRTFFGRVFRLGQVAVTVHPSVLALRPLFVSLAGLQAQRTAEYAEATDCMAGQRSSQSLQLTLVPGCSH